MEGVQEIFRLDPEGRVASCKAGAELITGWGANEIIGRHESRFCNPEDIAKPEEQIKAAIAKGAPKMKGGARARTAHSSAPEIWADRRVFAGWEPLGGARALTPDNSFGYVDGNPEGYI